MANGAASIITQIDEMLEKDTIPAKACSKLILQMLKDIYSQQKEFTEKMDKIYPAYKVVMWIGGVLGVMTIGLIWGILTHSVSIIFP